MPHLLSTLESWVLLFKLFLKKIVSRNTLSTIPFHVTLFTTTETYDILPFLQTFRNYFSYQNSVMNVKATIIRISNPFIYWFQSAL